jgi:predicted Abi (CAAX) family protease
MPNVACRKQSIPTIVKWRSISFNLPSSRRFASEQQTEQVFCRIVRVQVLEKNKQKRDAQKTTSVDDENDDVDADVDAEENKENDDVELEMDTAPPPATPKRR